MAAFPPAVLPWFVLGKAGTIFYRRIVQAGDVDCMFLLRGDGQPEIVSRYVKKNGIICAVLHMAL